MITKSKSKSKSTKSVRRNKPSLLMLESGSFQTPRPPINPYVLPLSKGNSLFIGPNPWRLDPERVTPWLEKTFTAIVKVSDCPSHRGHPLTIPTIWIAFQELSPFPYESLFVFKHTMDELLQNGENTPGGARIYLHCEAGVSRSQALGALWINSLAASQGGPLTQVPAFPSGQAELMRIQKKGLLPEKAQEFLASINNRPQGECLTILDMTGLPLERLPKR